MCAACVAQGVVYVGGAVAGLQVLGARAKARRTRKDAPAPEPASGPEDKDGSG
jgi:hypothetical protein